MNRRLGKAVVNYLMATRNEIAVDDSLYSIQGLSSAELGYAPRPSKIITLCKNRRLLRVGINLFKLFWRNGGAFLFYLIEWWRISPRAIIGGRTVPPSAEVYGLAFSSRTVDLATPAMKGPSFVWGSVPWVEAQFGDEKVVSLLAGLGFKDFMLAFFLSCLASRKLNASARTRAWGLQSYTAFRWFCVWLALERLPARRFLSSEHFDRWAILADAVLDAKRHENSAIGQLPGLILVQHGVLASLGAEEGGEPQLPVRLSARLRNVIRLYAFDNLSSKIFRQDVFSRLCQLDERDVYIYKPSLTLLKMADAKTVNILFVGHPLCEELHITVASMIEDAFDVGCFYKPHPANPCSERVFQAAWSIIQDRCIFPVVDVLISYPSTLVLEYEGVGVPAIMHPLNMSAAAAGELASSVLAKLEALGCDKKASRA